ncbi:lipopolysaccharide biosynthesis protein [Betaproteobacteria bacterium]|nr:lipopolysaccharide biosynthesis protein [Betaproteobacteria bacterium]
MNRHNPRHAMVRRALVLDTSNLGGRVVSGASFTFLSIILRTLLTIGSLSILARLLTPRDFGYLAMATVVTEFAAMLGSFGLSNILIQRRRVTRLQLDTVFWTAFGIGLVLALGVFGISFLSNWLFADPALGGLLRVLCLTFIFSNISPVPEALLARMMRFRTDFVIQVSALALQSTVAVVCAWNGFGVWSLIMGSITRAFAVMTMLILVVRYVPRLRFNLAYLMSTWKTSSSYFGNTMLYYTNMNVDLFLIGRQLGANVLGHYQNARSLTDEVRGRLAMPLQRVLFPAFASIQNDIPRLQQSVLKSSRIFAAVICPVGFGISAAAPEIVPVLYGDQWTGMIPILTVLGISAAFRASTAISYPIFNSQNKVSLSFKYNVMGTLILVISIFVALPFGLKFVAAAISINALFSVLLLWVSLRLIGLGFRAILHILLCPTAASLAMWICIVLLRNQIQPDTLNIVLQLLLTVVLGALVYGITLITISRQSRQDIKTLAGKFLHH